DWLPDLGACLRQYYKYCHSVASSGIVCVFSFYLVGMSSRAKWPADLPADLGGGSREAVERLRNHCQALGLEFTERQLMDKSKSPAKDKA
ncbi:unnamed protein product, partial [Amoebophrya sp. A25]